MNRRNVRQTVYVCSSIAKNGDLLNKILVASSQEEARTLFYNQTLIKAKEVFGPFYKKRVRALENARVLKFSNQTKKAIFDDWLVNAFLLKEPEDQAYLVFIKRTDGKKISPPTGVITVPISNLRFI